jgi:hypothetical protein
VFAPASPDRARVVPKTRAAANERGDVSTGGRQHALTWAQRLKRVFAIDIETCRQCGGRLRVIACIEAPAVIDRILAHLGREAGTVDGAHPSRAPPTLDQLIRLLPPPPGPRDWTGASWPAASPAGISGPNAKIRAPENQWQPTNFARTTRATGPPSRQNRFIGPRYRTCRLT